MNVCNITQVGMVTLIPDAIEEGQCQDTEEGEHGSGEMDLSEFLIDRIESSSMGSSSSDARISEHSLMDYTSTSVDD